MALGTRELLLVIRARDEATRVLGRLSNTLRDVDKDAAQAANDMINRGGAMVSLGAGMAGIGAAGAAMLYDMTEAAIEYEHAASRALTQTGDIEASLEDLKRIGRDVARDIPAPFESMQDALFTIFSTIETDLPGAEKVLREFSKSAVAGQTDLQTVTEGSLQVLNGFQLGIEEVGRVSDVMFELVAEGVGTFEEFVTNIGKATPSASRAGQDIESLAGMMAFMTRNGLSGAMAATSAARSFDLLANAKVGERMEAMGVQVKDASGEFRPMADIVTDLQGKLGSLTAPERAEALTNLFKGSGNNVAARRFFDLAIPGFQSLNDLTGEMQNSSGAMERAYDIMLKSPQTQTEALNNRFAIMRTEIGERLIPIKLRLLEVLASVLGWWEKLPKGVQTAIIFTVAITSALLILVGIVIMVAGGLAILQGTAMLFGTTIGAVVVAALPIIAVLAAIAVAVFFAIKYWDEIKAAVGIAWDWIVEKTRAAWDWISGIFSDIWGAVQGPIQAVLDFVQEKWDVLVSFFEGLWARVVPPIQQGWEDLKAIFWEGVNFVIEKVQGFWDTIVGVFEMLQPQIDMVVNIFNTMWEHLKVGWDIVMDAWDAFFPMFKAMFDWIVGVLKGLWLAAQAIFKAIVEVFIGLWNGVVDVLSNLWSAVTHIFGGALEFISNFFGFFVALFTGNWDKLWGYFKGMMSGIGNVLLGIGEIMAAPFIFIWNLLGGVVKGIGQLLMGLVDVFLNMVEGIINFGGSLIDWFLQLPGLIGRALMNAGSWLLSTGGDILQGFIDGLNNFLGNVWQWWSDMVMSVVDWVKGLFGISSPSTVFLDIGKWLLQGFLDGIVAGWNTVWGWISGFGGRVLQGFINIGTWLWNAGKWLLDGFLNGVKAGWNWLWNYIVNFPGNLLRGFDRIGDWLLDAGGDLLRGLWNGISNTASWLKDKIMDWAGRLLPGWVKDILGIDSPSKVFASLGVSTMEGFAVGMDRGAIQAAESAANAAWMVNDAFNGNLGLTDPTFSSYANGYVGGGSGGAASAAAAAMGNTGTNGAGVKIDIHTQEINPLQHAAELGDLIVNRVG